MRDVFFGMVFLQYTPRYRKTAVAISKDAGGSSLWVLLAVTFTAVKDGEEVVSVATFQQDLGVIGCDAKMFIIMTTIVCIVRGGIKMLMIVVVVICIA